MTGNADASAASGARRDGAAHGDGSWGAPTGMPVPPAPLHRPGPDQRGRVQRPDRRPSHAGQPFDSLRSGIEWWYGPFVEPRTWIGLGWLFVGALWGVLTFAIVVSVVAIVFGLSFAIFGVLLVVPGFATVSALAGVERRRAGWVGDVIPAPQFAAPRTGLVESIMARLRDAARWRQVLFFVLFGVTGPVFFALAALPWLLLVAMVLNVVFFAGGVFGIVIAAVLPGLAPRASTGVVWVARSFTASLLGPTDNAELRERVTELSGQRQQILDAVADERRRIERNLHDGVQQQLVALGIDIGRASARLDSDPETARQLLADARDKVRGSIGELRLIGRGLHPAVLEDRGLDAALSAVVANSPIPIAIDITTVTGLPEDMAATAYYIANEAVANVLKHAHARIASIRLDDDRFADGRAAVRLTVHDDGRGGADIGRGSGLAGMRARVEGVDGVFRLDSPAGGPTTLVAVLPIERPTTLIDGRGGGRNDAQGDGRNDGRGDGRNDARGDGD